MISKIHTVSIYSIVYIEIQKLGANLCTTAYITHTLTLYVFKYKCVYIHK